MASDQNPAILTITGETVIECPGTPDEVIQQLDTAARRGKLPGFTPVQGNLARKFSMADFGSPFESCLDGEIIPTSSGSKIRLAAPRLKPLFPWVFALLLAATVWPGSWLTDSMIRTYWDWYSARPDWVTYAWYIPLTLPFCPFAMRSALKKSRAGAAAEMPDLIQKISAASGGRIVPGDP